MIFNLFTSIAFHLQSDPERLTSENLDKLAAMYQNYAYIGNRQLLSQEVLRYARQLQSKWAASPNSAMEWNLPTTTASDDWAAWWYGRRDWQTNSGVFPDFVLGWTPDNFQGNGALLELKDSRGAGIASFNSTLPTAQKSLSRLNSLVQDAVRRYDLPFSLEPDYPDMRDCFYLVRTHSGNAAQSRLSIVQGTFFETIATQDLLSAMWEQLLSEAGLAPDKTNEILEALRALDRDTIAVTRRIERASIKPRFRIMAEVEADGNPHQYAEIPARTINLILKPSFIDWEQPLIQIIQWLREMEIDATPHEQDGNFIVHTGPQPLLLRWSILQHRRNGKHLLIQMAL